MKVAHDAVRFAELRALHEGGKRWTVTGDRLAALVDDVDGGDTSLRAWFRGRFDDALVAGRAWAWVSPPTRPPSASSWST